MGENALERPDSSGVFGRDKSEEGGDGEGFHGKFIEIYLL